MPGAKSRKIPAVSRPIAARRSTSTAQSSGMREFSPTAPEGPLMVWAGVVQSLESAGLAEAGPEYLRLSQVVCAARSASAGTRRGGVDEWEPVRALGRRAVELLTPVVEAARLLSELPGSNGSVRTRAGNRPRSGRAREQHT